MAIGLRLFGFAPPRCRRGCLMYTRATSLPILYIRNIIPEAMSIPLLGYLVISGRGHGLATMHA